MILAGLLTVPTHAQTGVSGQITYQGELTAAGGPVNGPADMIFTLWSDAVFQAPPLQVGGPITFDGVGANPAPVQVTNSRFTVLLDPAVFGPTAFDGKPRWLQVAVRFPAGSGAYTTLSPRQPVTATPYALKTRGLLYVNSVAELRAAITNLPAEGGRIMVGTGTYALTEPIIVNRDNALIEGDGPGTYFRLADHANRPCFILGDPNCNDAAVVQRRGITLRRMRIDGNWQNQDGELWPGTCLRNNCVTVRKCLDSTVEEVFLENARSGGIVSEKGCVNLTLRGVVAYGCFFDGFAMNSTTRSTIVHCTGRNNIDSGFTSDCDFDQSLVDGCFFVDNAKNGMFISNASNNLVTNCTIRGNLDQGVFIRDGTGGCAGPSLENVFSNNTYYCNANWGLWQAGAGSLNNVVEGGLFKGNGSGAITDTPGALLIRNHPALLTGTCP